jgi:hypothetical protein
MGILAPRQKMWTIRFVAFLFVILCTNTLRHVGEPRPLHLQVVGALIGSLVLNIPLLLSTFLMKRWGRYALGIALIPCALGVSFVMTDYHFVLAALSLLFHFWLITELFKSKVMA